MATVQQVSNSVQSDVMNGIGTNHPLIIDYCNRISLDLLRASRWDFLLSDVQRFLTRQGVTDYWIGATGGGPAGSFDTGLNDTDVKFLKHGSVFDRSNFRILGTLTEKPISAVLSYTDSTSRPGRPAVYRSNISTPGLLNIYPAPDQQNNQSPQPPSPLCSTTAGGALPARTYWVTLTLIDSLLGESTAPISTEIYIPANQLLVVQPPVVPITQNDAGIQYNKYNIYASSVSSTPANATLQNVAPVSTASTFTEPNSGLTTTGLTPPSFNSCATFNGYVIEFRYYKSRTLLTTAGQTLQIPDDYFDVVVSGVNWLAFKFLGKNTDAQEWFALYKQGITSMVRDRVQASRFSDYISPDPTSLGGMLPTIETIDLSMLQP